MSNVSFVAFLLIWNEHIKRTTPDCHIKIADWLEHKGKTGMTPQQKSMLTLQRGKQSNGQKKQKRARMMRTAVLPNRKIFLTR